MSEGVTCLGKCRINGLFSDTLIQFLTSQIPDIFALLTALPRMMVCGFEVAIEKLHDSV